MLGRSDGILKPGGVRFGSAEIYNLVLEHFAAKVEDGLCIGRRREGENDEIVVLLRDVVKEQRREEGRSTCGSHNKSTDQAARPARPLIFNLST